MARVTVLLCVYNGEEFLREAIESILAQTYTDFEFIVVDDCSTDTSAEILRSYSDTRIRLISNPHNLGLTKSLNVGLKFANGEYIARLDADDYSMPERLARQVTYMDNNPAVGVAGTFAQITTGEIRVKTPQKLACLKELLLLDNVFIHSSVMIRRSVLVDNQLGYDEHFKYAQDYKLWADISECCALAIIPDVLVTHRVSSNQISVLKRNDQAGFANQVRIMLLERLFGRPLTESERSVVLDDGRNVDLGQLVGICNLISNTKQHSRCLTEVSRKFFKKRVWQYRGSKFSLFVIFKANFLAWPAKFRLLLHYFLKTPQS